MTGIELIAAERERQQRVEEFDFAHDDAHTKGQLSGAASAYAFAAKITVKYGFGAEYMKDCPPEWPWDESFWKPSDDPVRNLVKAGALLAAEIDRVQRTREGGK